MRIDVTDLSPIYFCMEVKKYGKIENRSLLGLNDLRTFTQKINYVNITLILPNVCQKPTGNYYKSGNISSQGSGCDTY